MKYIFGNWKMKLKPNEEVELAKKLVSFDYDVSKLALSIHPTFLTLQTIAHLMKTSPVALGAQDCFYEDQGAYTGEISPYALKNIGCSYVIIGHSERRRYAHETDEIINKKIRAVIDHNLTPILCVGERREHREIGNKDHIVRRQLELALENIKIVGKQKLLVAYEPVWAIGSGIPATPEETVYMHKVLFQTLIDIFSPTLALNNTAIIYGGSVDPSNVNDFLKEQDIHGVLVGTASVHYETFKKMIGIAEQI